MPIATVAVAADTLMSSHRWKHRVLVIDADRLDTHPAEQLAARTAGVMERHIIWYVLEGNQVTTNAEAVPDEAFAAALRTYFQRTELAVVILGKDGGIKRVDERLNLESVFALIDGMPMRRREMRD